MADKTELQHVRSSNDYALVQSEVRKDLIARAHKDANGLLVSKPDLVCIAAVKSNGKWGFVDKNGTFVVEPLYTVLRSYACGRAAFSLSPLQQVLWQTAWVAGRSDKDYFFGDGFGFTGMKWGYLGPNGKIAISPRFESARDFVEDLAGVAFNGGWGFIDKDGMPAVELRFEGVRDFHDGIAVARIQGMSGFIDRCGDFVIEPNFDYVWEFSEGLALAEIAGNYGFIDKRGKFAIAPQFNWGDHFHAGVARVTKDDVLLLIDKEGNIISQCDEDEELVETVNRVEVFDDGLIRKRVNEKFGFVDENGDMVIEPKFSWASDFKNGMARIRCDDRQGWGFIDKTGTMLISCQFDEARDFQLIEIAK